MIRAFVTALILASLTACSYNVTPNSAPAVNIYTTYQSKIPGEIIVVFDSGAEGQRREIAPASMVCQAFKYKMDISATANDSVIRTFEMLVENVSSRQSLPSRDELKRDNLRAAIVTMDTFNPRIRCSQGFWEGNCTASTDLSFGVRISDGSGPLLATSAGSSRTVDGGSGSNCEGGVELLSRSVESAMRDTMERLAERISGSNKLRGGK